MKKKLPWIAGLDLSPTQFTFAAGHPQPQGRLSIKAIRSVPAQGFEAAMVSDPIECADQVARLIRQVESSISDRISVCYTAVHGSQLKSDSVSASIPIADPSMGIS